MLYTEIEEDFEKYEIEQIIEKFEKLKSGDSQLFTQHMDKTKLIFLKSNDILLLNKIALVFNEFKIHSSVALIVSKLILKKFHKNGGTLLYSLSGLRKVNYIEELRQLWKYNISYEMEQMLFLIGIEEGN